MALAMADMCLSMSWHVVPRVCWVVLLGAMVLLVTHQTLVIGEAGRCLRGAGLLLGIDLLAMGYMTLLHDIMWPPLSYALIGYFLGQAGLWFAGRIDTDPMRDMRSPPASISKTANSVVEMAPPVVAECPLEHRLTLGTMAPGMAYMLATMTMTLAHQSMSGT